MVSSKLSNNISYKHQEYSALCGSSLGFIHGVLASGVTFCFAVDSVLSGSYALWTGILYIRKLAQ